MLSDFINKEVFAFSSREDARGIIDGTIDKTDSIVQSLVKVEQAVQAARRDFCKERWLTSPVRFFKGLSSRQIQATLKGVMMTELRPFLGDLCRPLFPWIHSPQDARYIAAQAAGGDAPPLAVEGMAWSRSWGKPVVARFGGKHKFNESHRAMPVGQAFGFECEQQIATLESAHLEGGVWTLTGVSFDRLFAPPPRKRVDESGMSAG
jgi:hypothetical protein